MSSTLISIAALVIVLGVLVFVHEAGHFVAAKWAGIYVHRFSLGLGAPVKALTWKRGETVYVISWLPLGGYVKMASREEEATSSALEGGRAMAPVPAERMFEAKPVWKRMIVIMAGVTMNAIFAWGVFTFLAAKNGEQIIPTTIVGLVIPDSIPKGAEAFARLQPGDKIVAINGTPVTSWSQIIQMLQTSSATHMVLTIEGKGDLVAEIPADALEHRAALGSAIQPWQLPVIGMVQG
ncbi:MAG: site-2 protease family protein, partial [Gemmatimonadota bacterium]